MSQRTYLWLGLIFFGSAIIILITFVEPQDLSIDSHDVISARLIFECAVLIVLVGIVGFLYSINKAGKFPKIPTDKNGKINFDDARTKVAIEKWAELFRELIYCQVMTHYDAVDEWGEDEAGKFVLWIVYFTSTEIYELRNDFDFFIGWSDSFSSNEEFADANKEDLHEIIINPADVKNLQKIYKKVKNEIYKFTVKASADKPD